MSGSPEDVDVDARFLLANERTLLAWVRTSLTLMAAGVAVASVATHFHARTAIGVVLVTLGVLAAGGGAIRYRRADVAIRRGLLPVRSNEPYFLAAALVLIGIGLAVAVLVES